MTENNAFERRTDTVLSRWARGKRTAPFLIALGAGLVILGFLVGDSLCRP